MKNQLFTTGEKGRKMSNDGDIPSGRLFEPEPEKVLKVYELTYVDLTQLGGPMGVHYDTPETFLGLWLSEERAKEFAQNYYTNKTGHKRTEKLEWHKTNRPGTLETGDMAFCMFRIEMRKVRR